MTTPTPCPPVRTHNATLCPVCGITRRWVDITPPALYPKTRWTLICLDGCGR